MTDSPCKKVLVIRFNAIGDLVLTSPTVKVLAEHGYEVHFLVKAAFASILTPNPHLTKVWTLTDSLSEVISQLKAVHFDYVVDLHNNFRSKKVAAGLSTETFTLKKDRIGLWLLTNLSINKINDRHIVYRFLDVIQPLGIKSVEPKTEYYFPADTSTNLDLPERYLAIAIGAAWKTKEIPLENLAYIIETSEWRDIVLIGGPDDLVRTDELLRIIQKPVSNLVGKLSIASSALVVQKAAILLTGDTGMMHIAAALSTDIVAVFGSTHPILGYTPFMKKSKYTIIQNEVLGCRPCTKQGKSNCPKGHFKCMLNLDYRTLIHNIDDYI